MKRIVFSAVFAGLSIVASAQTDLDTFETYADTTAMNAKWTGTTGFPTRTLEPTGGANGTNKYIKIVDGGFSMAVTAPDIVSPPAAGTYKVTFFYQNGAGADTEIQQLTLSILQGGNVIASKNVGSAEASAWTASETLVAPFGTGPLTLDIKTGNASEPAASYSCAFDEIKLVAATQPLAVNTFPTSEVRLSGTENLDATVSGGTGPYTVTFDVGDNASIEGTDSTAPYQFSLNTVSLVPVDTTGTITVRVRVTDNAAQTSNELLTFVADNRHAGREQLVINNNFSTFVGNLPAGWVEYEFAAAAGNATYGSAPGRDVAAGTALRITFTAQDTANRYMLRAIGKKGNYIDLQTWYWGKGSSNRMFYLISDDDITYTNPLVTAAQVNNAGWVQDVGNVIANFGLTPDKWVSIAPHMFNAGEHLWDDVNVKALKLPGENSADMWNLYE